MESGAVAVAVFAFLAIICLVPPLIWHARCRNIPPICLIIWLLLMDIKTFVNVIIWNGQDFYQKWNGQGYCDLMGKLEVGASSGKVTAIAALTINLYMVLSAKNSTFLQSHSPKKIAIEASICLITPILTMAFNYFIQSSRYVIVRYQGCILTFDQSPKAIPLLYLWPLLWSIVALVFASMTIFSYIQKRKDVKDLLKCTNSKLDIKRFARLLIFCVLIIMALLPLSIYFFAFNVILIQKAKGLDTSGDRSQIYYYDLGMKQLYDKFVNIGLSFITFLIFGLGSDALNMYRSFFGLKSNDDSRRFNNTAVKVPTDQSGTSQGTSLSKFTDSSTTREVQYEYADLMSSSVDSPLSLRKSVFQIAETSGKSWSPSTLEDLEMAVEIDELNRDGSLMSYPDGGIEYNFQVRRNQL